jgi:GMP synthase-like glutamine amidotransferase
MKPALVLQHLSADGPAYLATWLGRQGLAFDLRNAEAGASVPGHLDDHSALAILGGEMSANDPLPGLRATEGLVRLALSQGVPVIGHCLGGQLMARALGARVQAATAPEIGWQPLQVTDSRVARDVFGEPGPRVVFQWHHEVFGLPAGAERLAASATCPNQAFAIGPHVALQFHVELDAEKLQRWSLDTTPRYLEALSAHATVQGGDDMRAGAALHLALQQRLADRLYRRWWQAAVLR